MELQPYKMSKFSGQKLKNFLPSKNFLIIMGISVGVIAIFFIIFFLFGHKTNFVSKKSKLALADKTVSDLVAQDTDGDSIPDWEETLWGTDKTKKKTFGDVSDSTYVENKKKELKLEDKVEASNATETDKFAREFFAAYSAMKAGDVDPSIINNFSSSLGQQVVSPKLIDRYTDEEARTTLVDDTIEKQKYYLKIKGFFDEARANGLGDELEIVSTGIVTYENSGGGSVEELVLIGDAYIEFAKKVIEVETPASLKSLHLRIANSANNVGISVSNMAKIINDPLVGLSGLSEYQEYSDNLVNAVKELETMLPQ